MWTAVRRCLQWRVWSRRCGDVYGHRMSPRTLCCSTCIYCAATAVTLPSLGLCMTAEVSGVCHGLGTVAESALCASGLVPLVQLLCAEMEHAFEARSMTCPPWRHAKAMLSKWLPAKVGAASAGRSDKPPVKQASSLAFSRTRDARQQDCKTACASTWLRSQ